MWYTLRAAKTTHYLCNSITMSQIHRHTYRSVALPSCPRAWEPVLVLWWGCFCPPLLSLTAPTQHAGPGPSYHLLRKYVGQNMSSMDTWEDSVEVQLANFLYCRSDTSVGAVCNYNASLLKAGAETWHVLSAEPEVQVHKFSRSRF